MNHTASVTDYFKSPKWMMNTLLAGVCVFIPFIGPIVIKGWLITGFWGRQDNQPETFPDFDFNNFGKYLERGLWPFLVQLVSGLVVGVALCVVIIPVVMILTLMMPNNTHGAEGSCFGVFIFAILMILYVAALAILMIVMTPLTVRASLTQQFGASFNFAFVKRFIALTWKETIIASLFLMAVSIAFVFAGTLLLCVGAYFATVPIYFCWVHLHKQLYQLYLSRGGEPVPLSPNLQDSLAPVV